MGRLFFAAGGRHPKRRWYRQINALRSGLANEAVVRAMKSADYENYWDYAWLCRWLDQEELTRDQVSRVIKGIILEALFDLIQANEYTYQLHSESELNRQLVVLDPLELMGELQEQWQRWQRARIADRIPDYAPVIRRPDLLQQQASPGLYQTLTRLLNGQKTLRDIAHLMRRPVLEVTASILHYLQSGIIELVSIGDVLETQSPPSSSASSRPLVVCIDDSTWVCQSLQHLITKAGFQFLSIQDPTRAIPQLLLHKPQLIFLDLRMPNTNGYELCGQLRRLSQFQETPIIILTGHDGIIDRMRAKMVGATDFLSKSADDVMLLSCLKHYIQPTDPAQGFNTSRSFVMA